METSHNELNISEQVEIPAWEAPLLLKESVDQTGFDWINLQNGPLGS